MTAGPLWIDAAGREHQRLTPPPDTAWVQLYLSYTPPGGKRVVDEPRRARWARSWVKTLKPLRAEFAGRSLFVSWRRG